VRRALAAIALVLSACGGGAPTGTTESREPTPGTNPVETQPAPSPSEAGVPIEAPGIEARVPLREPATEGAGHIPAFGWAPVAGASSYLLVVQGADGNALWAWEGGETRVMLGGVEGRSLGEAGPVLEPGSAWSVAALDAERHVIAVSVLRPVSP